MMRIHLHVARAILFAASFAIGDISLAQDDVADVPSQDLNIGDDQNKRYFLIGPADGATQPESGFGLVVVLPGGSGDAEFHPFVKRIFKHAIPDGFLVAQPVAVTWNKRQQIVWPTSKNRERGMKFTTEQFIDGVIDDVGERHQLDPERIFTLSWSSSGPAAYAASLKSSKVKGSFIAMSVFNSRYLPSLEKAKGHRYFIYHSPQDQVCPFWMARKAAAELPKRGAEVEFVEYAGGHGWRGNVFENIRTGIDWLAEPQADAQ